MTAARIEFLPRMARLAMATAARNPGARVDFLNEHRLVLEHDERIVIDHADFKAARANFAWHALRALCTGTVTIRNDSITIDAVPQEATCKTHENS